MLLVALLLLALLLTLLLALLLLLLFLLHDEVADVAALAEEGLQLYRLQVALLLLLLPLVQQPRNASCAGPSASMGSLWAAGWPTSPGESRGRSSYKTSSSCCCSAGMGCCILRWWSRP
ncbi:hypothetical protein CC86DRAFT_38859 [Ophiobolus disseminans]|uniref:Uncharacterized protein n=1 Tax=Ophiobolus disseminans TaxID=1469910 RepID=A0A6A6ZYD5_9PLEO|nr:hypothetical protein CC86DRAFT_38859 [Ophiobolus disseminans]